MISRFSFAAVVVLLSFIGSSCSQVRRRTYTPTELVSKAQTWDGKGPVLKLHMRDGALYVLNSWAIHQQRLVIGNGTAWDFARATSRRGTHEVPLTDVVLAETNVVYPNLAIAAFAVLTVASIGLGVYCYTTDKACFGSCPTFYVKQAGVPVLAAEGFSHAIAPSLESTDVDALAGWRPTTREVTVRMTNEAPETHVVRHVRLLAIPRGDFEDVYQLSKGGFRPGSPVGELQACAAAEGDCVTSLGEADRVERASLSDETNLATREDVTLRFGNLPADMPLGVAVRFRQSFMTTFLIYQWLAYLGTRAGDALAAFERQPPTDIEHGIVSLLGELEFEVHTTNGWQAVGSLSETGPLALETKLLELPGGIVTDGEVELRMRGTKGFWRVDQVAIVQVGERVAAVPIEATTAQQDRATRPELLHNLRSDTTEQTITFRGDGIDIGFTLPADPAAYGYFLESRGYYLEWMRSTWLEQEDPAMAAMMVTLPKQALRILAPKFKELEPHMDRAFWASRYRPNTEGTR